MRNAKLIAACTAALGLVVLTTNGVHAAQGGGSKLGQRDEELVLQAQQAGKNRVVLLIAATKGAMTQAAADVSRLGGQIQFRDDTLGYLRVSVPIAQVKAVAALASVQSVDVDELVPLPDPRPDPEGIAPISQSGGAERRDSSRQRVSAHRRDRCCAVHRSAPDLGRSRRDDRRGRSRHHSRSSEPAHHLHRREKGRGLGDGHRSVYG